MFTSPPKNFLSRWAIFAALSAVLVAGGNPLLADERVPPNHDQSEQQLPDLADVKRTVKKHFEKIPGFRPGDLITKSDAAPVFRRLQALGWEDVVNSEAASKLLDDGEFLVRELRSPRGRVFMRRVSGYRLVYDRLDRVSREPGGKQLIHDLLKLPDGHRYAKVDPGPAVPSLVDFLPKNASGKTRRVKDIDEPTGRIYTVKDLLRELEASHREAQKSAK